MLKTNSKAVSEKIKLFIIDNTDFEGYTDFENVRISLDNFKEVCKTLFTVCKMEKFYSRYNNNFDMFFDWFCGLPSCFNTACYLYNGSAIELLGEWLEQTEAEKSKYTESEAENKVNYLLAKMILNNCR